MFARPATAPRSRPLTSLLGHGAIGLITGVPFFLLVLLVLVLMAARPAAADDRLSCGATDLVAALEKSDPAAYAKLEKEGEETINSTARFWKVEKPGIKPDWLLGTMHVTDPRVTDLPEAAKAAYAAADAVILESDEILNEKGATAKLMTKPELMFFTGRQSLDDFLSPGQEKDLEDLLKARAIPFQSVIKMKPWIVTSMISLSPCELARKSGGAAFLDMKLARDAVAQGKEVIGLETMAEQIEAMASLPMDFHVRSLVAASRYPQYTADMMETTLGLYLAGKIGMIFPASVYFAPVKNSEDFADMAVFEERLITRRNHVMAERAGPTLDQGNIFMAVGALHLMGKEGVVELLRGQGFTLTPIF